MYGKRKFKVSVGDRKYQVEVEEIDVSSMRESEIMEETEEKDWGDAIIPDPVVKKVGGGGVETAPMSGKILDISVKVGDAVSAGDILLILEAMKMENSIPASKSGKVKEIKVKVDDSVETGQELVVIG